MSFSLDPLNNGDKLPSPPPPSQPPTSPCDSVSTLASPSIDSISLQKAVENQPIEKQAVVDPNSVQDVFPDGGLSAWSVVVGAWCCIFVSVGWISCIGDFQSFYQENQLKIYSAGTIGWTPSTQVFLLFALSPVFGHIFDGYGPRPLLVAGTFFHIAGLVCLSFATKYYQVFLAQSVCSAAGASAIFWAANLAVCTWFRCRREFAVGLAATGSAVGGVIGTIVDPILFERVGFGNALRVIAFAYLGLLVVALLTVRSRITHAPSPFAFSAFFSQYKDPCVLVFSISGIFLLLGLYLPYDFLVIDAMSNGMTKGETTYLLVALNATGVIGRIIPTWLCDRIGRFNVLILCTISAALLVLGLWIPTTRTTTRFIFAALYGVPSSALLSLLPTLAAQILPIAGKLGSHTGAMFLLMSPGFLLTLPIGGFLLGSPNHTSSITGSIPMKIFCGLTMVIAAAGFVVARHLFVCGKKAASRGQEDGLQRVTVRLSLT